MTIESEEFLNEKWRKLLELDHFEHEDIIRVLQDNPDPRSVKILAKAIQLKPKLDYLEYDDYGAYYKKCLWALVSIGTAEAFDFIRRCSMSEIPELREQALYRLGELGN
ncbi:MAG: hypothetical protein QM785_09910 [Pyrinomonadaceae bacterium]